MFSPDAAKREDRDRIRSELEALLRSEPQKGLIRRIVLNRLHDIENQKQILLTLGWKHMCPPVDLFLADPKLIRRTLFLVTVKHPVFWALSLHRRPYHDYFRSKKMSFSEFIRHMFIPTDRDNVGDLYYRSPLELYAAKVEGYQQLAKLGVALELVRYEDLLDKTAEFARMLSSKYGLRRLSEVLTVPQLSTKGDERALEDFRSIYKLEDVVHAVCREDYEFILAVFGAERLRWLGYSDG
jgi:hypothetical protein